MNNNESSSDIKLLDEVTEFDGEVEDAVIEGLQNDSKDILDELEKWRNEFLRYGTSTVNLLYLQL